MTDSMDRHLLERLDRFFAQRGVTAYLVGGTVRDYLLGRSNHDLDVMVDTDSLTLGRDLADTLGAAFVPLHEDHATARVVLRKPQEAVHYIDLATRRGDTVEADLAGRDFTVNALAIRLSDAAVGAPHIVDPLGGRTDLMAGRLRAISGRSFRDDPLRLLRAVRLASILGFAIEPQTQQWMTQHAARIAEPSPERIRDELMRLFAQPGTALYLRLMDTTGLLEPLLPELVACKGVTQPAAHEWDLFDHLIAAVERVDNVLYAAGLAEYSVATEAPDARWTYEGLRLVLSKFEPELQAYLRTELVGGRQRYALLTFLTLLHDVGKPATRSVDDDGTIHFYEHEQVGAEIVGAVLRRLHFGRLEVQVGRQVTRHHMRPQWLAGAEKVTRRAIFRYFRDTGAAGVDVALLSLADMLAKSVQRLPRDEWQAQLDMTDRLLTAWFQERDQIIQPAPLLRGGELISRFGLEPGPIVGDVLAALREAQATGRVTSRAEALDYTGRWLEEHAGS